MLALDSYLGHGNMVEILVRSWLMKGMTNATLLLAIYAREPGGEATLIFNFSQFKFTSLTPLIVTDIYFIIKSSHSCISNHKRVAVYR